MSLTRISGRAWLALAVLAVVAAMLALSAADSV
jgi:hypothetical protein